MDGNDDKRQPDTEVEPGSEAGGAPAAQDQPEPSAAAPGAEPQLRQPRDSSGEIIALDIEPSEPEQPAGPDTEEDLRAQLDKKQNQLLRVAADFDNFRKRSRRDADDAAFRAKKDVLESLLPVIDNLELALSHAAQKQSAATDAESLREGVEMVLRQFTSAMEKFDVRPVEALGQAFDPNFHEALQQRETDEHPPGVIVEEFRRGYLMGDRLIRAAMVVVAKAPEKRAEEEEAAETGAEPPPQEPGADAPAGGATGETEES